MLDKENGNPGIYVEVSSLRYKDMSATMLIGFDSESFMGIRQAMSAVSTRLYSQEITTQMENTNGLIVPEKKLYVPK